MATHLPVAPPLPSGCVDMNKLHDAAVANTAPAEALAKACVVPSREKPAAKKVAAPAAAPKAADPTTKPEATAASSGEKKEA